MPAAGAIDSDGLDVDPADLAELLRVDTAEWTAEIPLIAESYARFGDRLPAGLHDELEALRHRLAKG